MKNKITLLAFLLPAIIFSQHKYFFSKCEWVVGAGATNFLGDLGGAPQIGTHGVKDWEWPAVGPVVNVGLRYKQSKYLSFKSMLSAGKISGDDKLTTEHYRSNRNLNFRSPVVEFSVQAELNFINTGDQKLAYGIKNARTRINVQSYLFGGVGVFYFNPQGNYKRKWISLRNLSTEGQGMPGGPKKYSQFSISFPVGAGIKFSLNQQCSIGFEAGVHYTLTDYMDDVSGNYYDNDAIRASKGDVAAYMANPALDKYAGGLENPSASRQTITGEQRGNPKHNDAFIFGVINLNYKINYQAKGKIKCFNFKKK